MIELCLLTFFILIPAFLVVTVRNPIHSILYLVLTFCNSSVLLLSIGVDFLGMIFIIVYVGAIAVLFLFCIMLLNVRINELNESFLKFFPIGALLGLTFFIQLSYIIFINFYDISSQNIYSTNWTNVVEKNSNIINIGQIIYTDYFLYFQLCAVTLLIAMIAAICLTLTYRGDIKRQTSFLQFNRFILESFRNKAHKI